MKLYNSMWVNLTLFQHTLSHFYKQMSAWIPLTLISTAIATARSVSLHCWQKMSGKHVATCNPKCERYRCSAKLVKYDFTVVAAQPCIALGMEIPQPLLHPDHMFAVYTLPQSISTAVFQMAMLACLASCSFVLSAWLSWVFVLYFQML